MRVFAKRIRRYYFQPGIYKTSQCGKFNEPRANVSGFVTTYSRNRHIQSRTFGGMTAVSFVLCTKRISLRDYIKRHVPVSFLDRNCLPVRLVLENIFQIYCSRVYVDGRQRNVGKLTRVTHSYRLTFSTLYVWITIVKGIWKQ